MKMSADSADSGTKHFFLDLDSNLFGFDLVSTVPGLGLDRGGLDCSPSQNSFVIYGIKRWWVKGPGPCLVLFTSPIHNNNNNNVIKFCRIICPVCLTKRQVKVNRHVHR